MAAIAWATPRVDLQLAVDIASAPAVGLGRIVQALVGFPVYGICWIAGGRSGPPAGPPDGWIPWGFIVEWTGLPATPRPAETIPPDIEAYYAVRSERVDALRAEIAAAETAAGGPGEQVRIGIEVGLRATVDFYPAHGSSPSSPAPLVLLTPPYEAAFAARYLGRWLSVRGMSAAVVSPDAPFLDPPIPPAELEEKFRGAVLSARMVLKALAGRPDIDARRIHYLGVSAGGIFGAILLAIEPEIRRAVLVLPGGNLPRIIATSEEPNVARYRKDWEKRGVPPAELERALARSLRTDPIHLARAIDPRRVLVFRGSRDTQVPAETGIALVEALGRPFVTAAAPRFKGEAVPD